MGQDSTSAWSALRKLPPSVWWLAGATLINRAGAMVFPFLVLYFHKDLGLPLKQATTIAALFGIGSGCAAPLGGWLADRYDAVKVLAWSMGGAGLVLLGFPLLHDPKALMVATFTMALLVDLARPSSLTALARLGGSQQSRDAFTLNYLAINLGMSVGPLVGGYLATRDYRWLFWVDGVSSVAASLVLLGSKASCQPPSNGRELESDWRLGATAFRLVFWVTIALWVFFTFFTATPVYVVDVLHRQESLVGWIWLINTTIIVLTTVWFNHWTRHRALRLQLTGASLLFSVGYISLYLQPGLSGLILCMVLLTIGEMLLFTNVNTFLQRSVPAHKLGKAMAVNAMAVSLSSVLAPPSVGYFFTSQNPNHLWIALACGGVLSAWGFLRLPEPVEPTVPS